MYTDNTTGRVDLFCDRFAAVFMAVKHISSIFSHIYYGSMIILIW